MHLHLYTGLDTCVFNSYDLSMSQEEELAKSAWARFRKVLNLSEIARELDISRSLISQWKAVPTHYLSKVVEITGIPREKLRPTPVNKFPWDEKGE